jgi:hypothetical protein
MKKIIFVLLAFIGMNQFADAQSRLTMNVNDKLCLSVVTVVFDDDSSEECVLGCTGSYNFDFGTRVITSLKINGTLCRIGVETEVTVNEGVPATSNAVVVGNTIVDDLNGLIR